MSVSVAVHAAARPTRGTVSPAMVSRATRLPCLRPRGRHVARRSAFGAALLVGIFECAPRLKAEVLSWLGRAAVTDYNAEGAQEQLVAIDLAYISAIALVNFVFPFVLVPVRPHCIGS